MPDLNSNIAEEIQKLAPTAMIELFEVDLTAQGDTIYRFHAGTNGLLSAVVWQGQTYQPWAIQASGFDFNTSGQIPRPTLNVGNVNGAITALALLTYDCLGAKVTRRRTMAKFLDAVNFPGGVNPTADSSAALPDEIYYVDRKALETRDQVTFELTAPFDVSGVQLPRRQIIQNVCPWKYRGAECGYTDNAYFKADDSPTPIVSEDRCGKRLSSCKARFGVNAELPFGGFPGAGLIS